MVFEQDLVTLKDDIEKRGNYKKALSDVIVLRDRVETAWKNMQGNPTLKAEWEETYLEIKHVVRHIQALDELSERIQDPAVLASKQSQLGTAMRCLNRISRI